MLFAFLLFALLVAPGVDLFTPAPGHDEPAAVRALLERYVDALASGDPRRIERAFWPGATIVGVVAPEPGGPASLIVQSVPEFAACVRSELGRSDEDEGA